MPASVWHYILPRCCRGTTNTLTTVILIVVLACLVHIDPVAASCRWWAPHSVQHVRVDGFIRFGVPQGCGAGLINVSVTFFALPQSTIVLDGWSMRRGGSVAIAGPPDAPWSIRDVAVIVRNSVIEAVDGPAVSVTLGTGYNVTGVSGIMLHNVSLYCSGSRLWSNSSNASVPSDALASVLSVTLSAALIVAASTALPAQVTIDRFTAVALDSDLRSTATAAATVNATAAVVSIATARYGSVERPSAVPTPLTVLNSVLYVARCNATATAERDVAVLASAAAVAGFAFGSLSSTVLTVSGATAVVVNSTASARSNATMTSASVVAGVAVAFAQGSTIAIGNDTTFFVGWSEGVSSSSTGVGQAVSSVAGVAIGFATGSPISIGSSTTLFLSWSHALSTSASSSVSASSIAGVAVGYAYAFSPVTIANSTTCYVGWSNATSSSTSVGKAAYPASTVAGIAVGVVYNSSAFMAADNTTLYLGWSNASTTTTTAVVATGASSTEAYGASSVAGIAVGAASTASPVATSNVVTLVVVCNAVSSVNSTGSFSRAASSVAGVAVGYVYVSPTSVINITGSVQHSVASSAVASLGSWSGLGDALTASAVAGVAVGHTQTSSPVTIDGPSTLSVGWSNASSRSVGRAMTSSHHGSTVGGIAVGFAYSDCAVTVSNSLTFTVDWSNATSANVCSMYDTVVLGACRTASSIGGAAVGEVYFSSAVTISGNVTFRVGRSSVSSRSDSTAAYGYAHVGSAVAGVAVGVAGVLSPVTISTNVTYYVGWCNATSTSTAVSAQANAVIASSVAGVGVGCAFTNSLIRIGQSTRYYIGSSTATSKSDSTSSLGLAYAAASVAGGAVGWTEQSPSNAAAYMASAAVVSAVVTVKTAGGTPSGNVSCLMVPSSTTSVSVPLSCRNTAPVDADFPGEDAASPPLPWAALSPAAPRMPWSLLDSDSIAAWRPTRTRTSTAKRSASRSPQSQTSSRSETPTTTTTVTQTGIPTNTVTVSRSESSSLSGSRERTTTLISATRSSTASRSGVSRTALPSHSSSLSRSPSGSVSAESRSATAATSASPSVSPSQMPLSADLATTPLLETATVSVAVVSAVVSIGSLTSGANAGRISVLLRMASCGSGSGEQEQQHAPLPWSSHPLGFGVSSAGLAVQYDAGAVLGNTAIAVAVAALHFAAACMRLQQRSGRGGGGASGLAPSAAWARFPGLSSTVHLYLMPLVAQSAVACIARGSGVGVVMGVYALVVLASVAACLTYHTVRTLAERMECSPPLLNARRGWLEPACEWRMRGNDASSSAAMLTPEQLCACFGAYFEDYHYASRWWLTVELTVALVSGMIGGLMDTSAGCVVVQALGVVPNAVYLVLLLWRRPYQARLDMATCTAVGTLLLASAVALCAGSTDASTATALAASVVGFVPALCTPYKLAQQLRTMRRLKQQRREGEKRHQAHLALLEETDASHTTLEPLLPPSSGTDVMPPPCEEPPASPLNADVERSEAMPAIAVASIINSDAIGHLLDDLLLSSKRGQDVTCTTSTAAPIFDLDALLADSSSPPPAALPQQQQRGVAQAVNLL